MKKYIVKSIKSNTYYGVFSLKWDGDISEAYHFDEIEELERFIQQEDRGIYIIETIYVIS